VTPKQRSAPREQRVDPRARIAGLALLDRALATTPDDDLVTLVGVMPEEHRRELARLVGTPADAITTEALRAAGRRGRLDGTLEAIAVLLTDGVLADCIEQLGDRADLPSRDDLVGVAPGLVERHGLAATRLMLASAVAGDAPARTVIVELLKRDELLALPEVERAPAPARPEPTAEELAERERIKAARAERKAREKELAAKRRAAAQASGRRR
jgi:hypothetical protein